MARPLVGWLLWVGPWQDGYACDGVGPGWLLSHTKCAAIGPVVGKDSQSGQKWPLFGDCKGIKIENYLAYHQKCLNWRIAYI